MSFIGDFDITQNMKLVEKLKSELLSSIAELYSEMTSENKDNELLQTFSDIVILTYILGSRLGINYSTMDTKIISRLRIGVLEDNNILHGELVELLKHIDKSRN